MIKVRDIVKHTISGLYFICENAKQEKWMNSHPIYIKVDPKEIPNGYFKKVL
jgi:hypothetical protein